MGKASRRKKEPKPVLCSTCNRKPKLTNSPWCFHCRLQYRQVCKDGEKLTLREHLGDQYDSYMAAIDVLYKQDLKTWQYKNRKDLLGIDIEL